MSRSGSGCNPLGTVQYGYWVVPGQKKAQVPLNCHFRLIGFILRFKHPQGTSDADRVALRFGVGAQNSNLHSGWIGITGDYSVKPEIQVELLKEKISECLKRKEDVIIGFCRTGHFSIGYSIYVK